MVENLVVVCLSEQRVRMVTGGRIIPFQDTFRVAGGELAFLSSIC